MLIISNSPQGTTSQRHQSSVLFLFSVVSIVSIVPFMRTSLRALSNQVDTNDKARPREQLYAWKAKTKREGLDYLRTHSLVNHQDVAELHKLLHRALDHSLSFQPTTRAFTTPFRLLLEPLIASIFPTYLPGIAFTTLIRHLPFQLLLDLRHHLPPCETDILPICTEYSTAVFLGLIQ